MKIWHMNGAGNDFAVMDARDGNYDFETLSKELCKLLSADGFMAIDLSEKADFKLHFYNADGTRGEMCGNGSRCICRFAYEHSIAGENMTVETDAGIVYGKRLSESTYAVRLNNPGIVDLQRKTDCAYIELGAPGVPHAVKEVPGLSWEQKEAFRQMAKALRYDPAFPKGANANLYTWLDPQTIRILTYERGVEDYTLACGTGSASTAVVLWLKGQLVGSDLTVKNPGGDLRITLEGENGTVTRLMLEGPTEVTRVFEY